MITLEKATSISLEELVQEYNDTTETIWYIQQKLQEQMKESVHLRKTYEELPDQLYG